MSKYLYTEKDNAEVNNSINVITKAKDALIQDQGAVVLSGQNALGMFKNIKDIFSAESKTPTVKRYFTHGKGAVIFSVDGTIFEPTSVVCLAGKRFEEKYTKQIESFIFNDKEELDPDKLINLIFLVDFIKNDRVPITITTGRYKRLLPKIIASLNNFFIKNHSTLLSIHAMFSGMTSIQPPQDSDDDHHR
jgi:hypothetical protein